MKSLTKLTLSAVMAAASLGLGSAYADHAPAAKDGQATEAKVDCSRLPADASAEQLTLCLQSLRHEQAARQQNSTQAFESGKRQGYDEGFRAGRSYSQEYRGGWGGD